MNPAARHRLLSRTGRLPIRACYPQVALRDRAAHVLAIGDIVEPNEAWRAHKKEATGSSVGLIPANAASKHRRTSDG